MIPITVIEKRESLMTELRQVKKIIENEVRKRRPRPIELSNRLANINKQLAHHITKAQTAGDLKTELRLLIYKTRNEVEIRKLRVYKSTKWQHVDGSWWWHNPQSGAIERTEAPGGERNPDRVQETPARAEDSGFQNQSTADFLRNTVERLAEGRLQQAYDRLHMWLVDQRDNGKITQGEFTVLNIQLENAEGHGFRGFNINNWLKAGEGQAQDTRELSHTEQVLNDEYNQLRGDVGILGQQGASRDDIKTRIADFISAAPMNENMKEDLLRHLDRQQGPIDLDYYYKNIKNNLEDARPEPSTPQPDNSKKFDQLIEEGKIEDAREIIQDYFDDKALEPFDEEYFQSDIDEDSLLKERTYKEWTEAIDEAASIHAKIERGDRNAYEDQFNHYGDFEYIEGQDALLREYTKNAEMGDNYREYLSSELDAAKEAKYNYGRSWVVNYLDEVDNAPTQEQENEDTEREERGEDSADDEDFEPGKKEVIDEMKKRAKEIDRSQYKQYKKISYRGSDIDPKEVDEKLVSYGWPLTHADIAQATGAYRADKDEIAVQSVSHDEIELKINPDFDPDYDDNQYPYTTDVTFEREPDGGFKVYGGYARANPKHPDYAEGIAPIMFQQLFTTAKNIGANAIELHAAGKGDGHTKEEKIKFIAENEHVDADEARKRYKQAASLGGWSGYLVWPLFGFDYKFDESQIGNIYAHVVGAVDTTSEQTKKLFTDKDAEQIKKIKTVQDLLKLPRGREIWERFGFDLNTTRHARFDLSEKSLSMKIFTKYLEKKMGAVALPKPKEKKKAPKKKTKKSMSVTKAEKPKSKDRGEFFPDITLDDKDEEILKQVWDEIMDEGREEIQKDLISKLNKINLGIDVYIKKSRSQGDVAAELKLQLQKFNNLTAIKKVMKSTWQHKDGTWWTHDAAGNIVPYQPQQKQPGQATEQPQSQEERPPLTEAQRQKVMEQEIVRVKVKFSRKAQGQGQHVDIENESELQTILKNTSFALVSAGKNPNNEKDKLLTPEQIVKRDEQLRGELVDRGFIYTKVVGHYGEIEDSYLVMIHDAEQQEAMEIGEKFNQDSVLFVDHGNSAMTFTTGENKGRSYKGQGFEVNPDSDFYTIVKLRNGNAFKFSMNINFDVLKQLYLEGRVSKAVFDFMVRYFGSRDVPEPDAVDLAGITHKTEPEKIFQILDGLQ